MKKQKGVFLNSSVVSGYAFTFKKCDFKSQQLFNFLIERVSAFIVCYTVPSISTHHNPSFLI